VKVVINTGASPFRFSQKALKTLYELEHPDISKNGKNYYCIRYNNHDSLRYDKKVINLVEKMGKESGALLVNLKVIDVPKGVKFYIFKKGNSEEVHEEHKVWK